MSRHLIFSHLPKRVANSLALFENRFFRQFGTLVFGSPLYIKNPHFWSYVPYMYQYQYVPPILHICCRYFCFVEVQTVSKVMPVILFIKRALINVRDFCSIIELSIIETRNNFPATLHRRAAPYSIIESSINEQKFRALMGLARHACAALQWEWDIRQLKLHVES